MIRRILGLICQAVIFSVVLVVLTLALQGPAAQPPSMRAFIATALIFMVWDVAPRLWRRQWPSAVRETLVTLIASLPVIGLYWAMGWTS